MLANILSVVALAALAVLFGWLATRAWRSRRGLVKWPAGILATLLTLLLVAITVVAVLGFVRMAAAQPNRVANVQVNATAEQLARGQRLANGCVDCHSSTGQLPLDGSKANLVEQFGAPPVGVIYAPNLTPAGPLKDWSDGEIIRAVREGVHKDGRAMIIMPSQGFYGLSDADAQALVAYLRSQPAIARDLPPTQPNILAALFVGGGIFPLSAQPPITAPRNAPPAAITAEYGEYLVSITGCRDCHGKDLAGRTKAGPTDAPSAPNLLASAGTWSAEDFVKTIRTGVNPQGHQLSDDMPWKGLRQVFTDEELRAVHTYIKSSQQQ